MSGRRAVALQRSSSRRLRLRERKQPGDKVRLASKTSDKSAGRSALRSMLAKAARTLWGCAKSAPRAADSSGQRGKRVRGSSPPAADAADEPPAGAEEAGGEDPPTRGRRGLRPR